MVDSLHLSTWIPLLAVAGLSAAYAIRVRMMGRARFERVERQGNGLILSKAIMEMGYWGIQPLARALVALRISANCVSSASLVVGAASGICLARGNFGLGGGLAAVAGILDALDGMVARSTGTTSRSGKVIDSSLDRYVEFFFIAGLAHHYRLHPVLQWIALFALLGSFMVSYSTALGEIFRIDLGAGAMRRPERLVLLILGAILSPLSITGWEPAGSASTLGYPMILALAVVAVVANASAAMRFRRIKAILDATEGHQKLHFLSKFSGKGLGIGLNVGPGGSGPVMNDRVAASPHAPE